MQKVLKIIFLFYVANSYSCAQTLREENKYTLKEKTDMDSTNSNKLNLTEDEWKNILPYESYYVLRQKGTERPFTGQFDKHWVDGVYKCKGCGNPLFNSETKFDAGCGWPSFFDVLDKNAVILKPDYSHNMVRTEVLCIKCEGHLGHVFDDGPNPTRLRYCINSVSLDFEAERDSVR